MSNTLSIEPSKKDPPHYTAIFNGIRLPFIKNIKISSTVGQMTTVIIEIIVTKQTSQYGYDEVVIKSLP